MDMGLQAPRPAYWRPDCSPADACFTSRLPPPEFRRDALLFIGSPALSHLLSSKEVFDYETNPSTLGNSIAVVAETRTYGGVCFSTSYARFPDSRVFTECRFIGARVGPGAPVYCKEYATFRALEREPELCPLRRPDRPAARFFVLHINDPLVCKRVGAWLQFGAWRLLTPIGSDVAKLIYTLASGLPIPTIAYGVDSSDFVAPHATERLDDGWAVNQVTYRRAVRLICDDMFTILRKKLLRVPPRTDEAQAAIRLRFGMDEIEVLSALSGHHSFSAGVIFKELGLTRHIIRAALEELAHSRTLQVVLCSVLCATRFKYLDAGRLISTACRKCGATDSFPHLLVCAELTPPAPAADPNPMILFLRELALGALRTNDGPPIPFRGPNAADVELDLDPTSVSIAQDDLSLPGDPSA